MLDEGKPLVHILRDERNITIIPRNIRQLRDILRVGNHRAIGWVVATGDTHPMMQFLMGMIASFFRLNYRRFRTINEGIAFLQIQDSSVQWAEANTALLNYGDHENGHHIA